MDGFCRQHTHGIQHCLKRKNLLNTISSYNIALGCSLQSRHFWLLVSYSLSFAVLRTFHKGQNLWCTLFDKPQTEIRTLVVDPGAFGGEFDHFAVEFSIEMNFKTENKLRLVRKPTKESWDKIRAELAERDLVKNFSKISCLTLVVDKLSR